MAAVLTVKEIKPSRFNDRAFKNAMLKGAKEAGKGIEKDFKKTTSTWDHKVKFVVVSSVDPNVEVLVGTDDKIYGYVNDGTGLWGPKHAKYPIFPKKPGGVLAFPSAYTAKTKPRVIGSTGGGPSGSTVFAAYVEHPGIEPREFDKEIQKTWTPRFKRLMEQAMSRAAKASGHGVP